MTSRLSKWDGRSASPARPDMENRERLAPPETYGFQATSVTSAAIDEAVDVALREAEVGEGTEAAIREVVSRDPNSSLATVYYNSRAAASRSATKVTTSRRTLHIGYALKDHEVLTLQEYAPEYNFRFQVSVSHDHPLAAAARIVDHALVLARLPSGIKIADIGGNPEYHVRAGNHNIHVCTPNVDVKDATRHKLRYLRIRQMERDDGLSAHGKVLARAYLEGDTSFVCNKRAQACEVKATALTSIHVYDIPMQDWPRIMSNKSAACVEGVMLFSPKIFEARCGEFSGAGARYEVDVAKDRFKMGFVGSPAWWYDHSLSEYLKYGADQLMRYEDTCYSYKIIERRGDTIFFRILKLQGAAVENTSQYFATPSINTVEVRSFSLARSGSKYDQLRPRVSAYPAGLWRELYSQAASDAERGVLDYSRLFNHYRTISVRQTINSVIIMAGEKVPEDEIVGLVVDVALCALSAVLKGQKEARELTEAYKDERDRMQESLVTKMFRAFSASLGAAGYFVVLPAVLLGRALQDRFLRKLMQQVPEWEPIMRVRKIDARYILPVCAQQTLVRSQAEIGFIDHSREYAPLDHMAAARDNPAIRAVLAELCPEIGVPKVPEDKSTQKGSLPAAQAKTKVAETAATSAVVSDSTTAVATDEDRTRMRKRAIREALAESEIETAAVLDSCRQAYSTFVHNGKPNVDTMIRRSEEYGNPDLWKVTAGVVEKSVRGLLSTDFRHAAAYLPRENPETGTRVCPSSVKKIVRAVYDSTGNRLPDVEETCTVLADMSFTGWALTTDNLLIYNGPEIVRSLTAALELDHDYEVVLEQGPPGCGKTYSILESYNIDDSHGVMCPVRESIQDTRNRISTQCPHVDDAVKARLRLTVRTVDSYLVNYHLQDRTTSLKLDTLFADECFMTHSGKWYAAAALLGVKALCAFGDKFQIPHVVRVQAPALLVRLKFDRETYKWLTFRCPHDAVASWNHMYDYKVRSNSKVKNSLREVRSSHGQEIPQGCVMMCMYQADKVTLRQKYGSAIRSGRVANVLTAHEAEGKTYKHVWLHRFDLRRRVDGFSLFDRDAYVLVAMSRHTDSFVYICPGDLGDKVSQNIKLASDPRRVAAAGDVASAGSKVEYL